MGELPDPEAIRAENLCHLSSVQPEPLIVPDSLEKGGNYMHCLSLMLYSIPSIKNWSCLSYIPPLSTQYADIHF